MTEPRGLAGRHAAPGPRRAGALLAGLLGGLLLLWTLDRLTQTRLPAGLIQPVAVERALAGADGPPASDAEWQPVSLPDSAPWQPGQARQYAWYRLRFELPASGEELGGLLLQRPHAAVRIAVNGAPLADAGIERRPLPEYRFDLRYNVSTGLLRAGSNEVLVLSAAASQPAGLARVWFGDPALMAEYKRQRNAIEKDAPEAAVQVIVVLALILLGVRLVRAREAAFGWFAAALLMWAAHSWLSLRNAPLFEPALLRWPLEVATLIGFVAFGLPFVNRLTGLPSRRAERALLAAAAAGAGLGLLVALAGSPGLSRSVNLGMLIPGVLLLGLLIAARLWRAAGALPQRRDLVWLLGLSALLLVVGARDWLLDLGWAGDWQSIAYLPFAAPLVFVVFGGILLHSHVEALSIAERATAELEAKVAQKAAEVTESWRRLTLAEGERARMEERERWMREMHDGVGGQLVQALAIADRSQVPAELREVLQGCLDELRLVFDAGDGPKQSLGESLGRLRERLTRRLRALGIVLDWDFLAMPELPEMEAERAMHVLRILQELIVNAIRHSGAKCIRVACRRNDDQSITIEVRDDGSGFILETHKNGRGLGNLRARARALGGQVGWARSGSGGTHAWLRFPALASS